MLREAENVQKRPWRAFPRIFWGGQLLGSGFLHNIAPLGFLRVKLQWQLPTTWLVDRPGNVISTNGPPTWPLFQSNRHSGHPGTVEGTSLSFISHALSIFISILIFFQLLSCHMGSPDSLSHGSYCPYQIIFHIFRHQH